MKILIFSDLHGCPANSEMEFLKNFSCHFCVSLGDNPKTALEKINNCTQGMPHYGIAGNHDEWDTPMNAGFTDIHGKCFKVSDISFAGFGGSHRYKRGSLAMMTQEESIGLAENMPPCDILFSHDSMYGELGDINDFARCGLKGISNYVNKNHVKVNICGHYHTGKTVISSDGMCRIINICGCAVIDTDDFDNVQKIF